MVMFAMPDMPEFPVLELFKYTNLIVHCLATWCVLHQLRRGHITAWVWREAWIWLLLAMGIILIYRVVDLWEEATNWRLLLAGPMDFCLLLGFARLARLLHRHAIVILQPQGDIVLPQPPKD